MNRTVYKLAYNLIILRYKLLAQCITVLCLTLFIPTGVRAYTMHIFASIKAYPFLIFSQNLMTFSHFSFDSRYASELFVLRMAVSYGDRNRWGPHGPH